MFLCTLLQTSKTLECLSLSCCHGILVSKIAEGLQLSSCSHSLGDEP